MREIDKLIAKARRGTLPPLPADDDAPWPGEKPVAVRKARAAFYGAIYDPKNLRSKPPPSR